MSHTIVGTQLIFTIQGASLNVDLNSAHELKRDNLEVNNVHTLACTAFSLCHICMIVLAHTFLSEFAGPLVPTFVAT